MQRILTVVLFFLLPFAQTSASFLIEDNNIERLDGSWTLMYYEINGKRSTYNSWEFYGLYKEGAKWELSSDGTGVCGGTNTKWSFDSSKKKLNVQVKNIFGYWITSIADADVSSVDSELHVSCTQLGQSIKFRLQSNEAKPLQIDAADAKLSLAESISDREVFSEIIETVPGLPKKLTVRREYETTISAVATVGTEVEAGVNLGPKMLASFSAELKSKLEVALGITLSKKDEVTETYELDGNKIVKVRVKWVERYRKGKLTLRDGTTKEFWVCIGLRTIPELVP